MPCIESYERVDLRTITLGVPPQEVLSLSPSLSFMIIILRDWNIILFKGYLSDLVIFVRQTRGTICRMNYKTVS